MSPDARVGIVLVSHSTALAEGAAELAAQISGGTVAIIPAGGTDDGQLGTSSPTRRSSRASWRRRWRRPGAGTSRRFSPPLRRRVMPASYEQAITLTGD